MNRSPTDEFQKKCDCMPEFEEDPAVGFFDEDLNESQESEWLGSADTEQSAILKNLGQEFELAFSGESVLPDDYLELADYDDLESDAGDDFELAKIVNPEYSYVPGMSDVDQIGQDEVRRRTGPQATLANLGFFTRAYIRYVRFLRKKLDCADLAIELWIRFCQRYGVPARFLKRFRRRRRWRYRILTRRNFRGSWDRFLRYIKGYFGAHHLIYNTYSVPHGHRNAVPGDIFLYQYVQYIRGRRKVYKYGHTQIILGVIRGQRGPSSDRICIAQGGLPKSVPEIRTYPISYFTRPIQIRLGRRRLIYTRELVGGGPRRYIGFRTLR